MAHVRNIPNMDSHSIFVASPLSSSAPQTLRLACFLAKTTAVFEVEDFSGFDRGRSEA